jgi:hypothetical protein
MLRSACHRADGRGFGAAINDRLTPHLVRGDFDSRCAGAIEGSRRLWAKTGHPQPGRFPIRQSNRRQFR